MNRRRYIQLISTAGMVCLLCIGWTSGTGNNCKQLLKSYVQKMSLQRVPKGKEIYYMNMEVVSEMNKKTTTGTVTTSHVQVFMTATQMVSESDYISIYYDNTDALYVIHPLKQIKWSKGGSMSKSTDRVQLTAHLQDSLIDLSDVVSCIDETIDNRQCKVIYTVLPKKYSDALGISARTFYYDKTQQSLYRVVVLYSEKSQLKKQVITYKDINFDYKGWTAKSARAHVFAKNGKLLPQYAGYKVEDLRKEIKNE